MGKKIVIKGADFSESGFKSVRVMNSIGISTMGQYFIVVGETGPVKEYLNGSDTIICNFQINNASFESVIPLFKYGYRPSLEFSTYNSKPQVRIGFRGQDLGYRPIELGKHTIEMTAQNVILDGSQIEGITGQENSAITDLWLFSSANTPGNYTPTDSIRINRFAIKDADGNYKVDLYPAVDEDGVACLYDSVSEKYYYVNSGTVIVE